MLSRYLNGAISTGIALNTLDIPCDTRYNSPTDNLSEETIKLKFILSNYDLVLSRHQGHNIKSFLEIPGFAILVPCTVTNYHSTKH